MTDRGPPMHENLKAEYEAGRTFERRFGEHGEPSPADAGRFHEPRSWLARTSDELKSWLGDQNAQRRRQWDEAAGDHTGQGPTVDMDEDARITADLSAALSRDARLDAGDIRIAVRDGAVDLWTATVRDQRRPRPGRGDRAQDPRRGRGDRQPHRRLNPTRALVREVEESGALA